MSLPITVWKYPLELVDGPQLVLTHGINIRMVGNQRGAICVWIEGAQGLPEREKIPVEFFVVGTGHKVPYQGEGPGLTELQYAGSVISDPFVWHVYWRINLGRKQSGGVE